MLANEASISKELPAILRGTICHVTGDPFAGADTAGGLECISDGALVIGHDGRIEACGPFHTVSQSFRDLPLVDRRNCFLLPGFVDCHIHFPQTLMIGAFGEQLLDWLEKYTFPEESKYKDDAYASRAAELFFQEAIAQGTTTALIFGAHFEGATEIAFTEALKRRFRAVMGMTMSDCNMPETLTLDAGKALDACERLIAAWHGKGKLRYAVTPRFAATCSPAMLDTCRQLMENHGDILLQTHINENHAEIEWVARLFPEADSYLDVYDRHGLLGPRSLFAHCIHGSDREIARMAESNCRAVHCPSSNSFMGSGLMPMGKYIAAGVRLGLGTDIAGGTSFSMLSEMGQAYKLQMLKFYSGSGSQGAIKLTAAQLLYLATLGGASALGLDSLAGNFQPGKCADVVVIDPARDTLVEARLENTASLEEKLFILSAVGNKSLVAETYIDGQIAHRAR